MKEKFIGFKLVFAFHSVLLLLFFHFSTPCITVFVNQMEPKLLYIYLCYIRGNPDELMFDFNWFFSPKTSFLILDRQQNRLSCSVQIKYLTFIFIFL